jgi:SH3-like domain-containing protein
MTKENRVYLVPVRFGFAMVRIMCVRAGSKGFALLALVAVLSAVGGFPPAAVAQETGSIRGPSGLALPRFVSLKSGRVNLRVGPGKDYAVSWRFVKSGLPVEIIQEYDTWRRIRDADGTEGWVSQSLLSGKRTAVASPWNRGIEGKLISLHAEADDASRKTAMLEPGVLSQIESCDGNWCKVEAGGAEGYVRQTEIWGAYPGEIVED